MASKPCVASSSTARVKKSGRGVLSRSEHLGAGVEISYGR